MQSNNEDMQQTLQFNAIPVSDKLGNLQPTIAQLLEKSSKKRIRYAAVSVDEVLDRVIPSGDTTGKYESWKFINGIEARVTPARLRTFKDNLSCVCCGRQGNVFLLERHVNERPGQYVNLYSASKDSLTLMTVDHILPDSIGGKYNSANFQTMCRPCNEAKKNYMPVDDIKMVLSDIDKYAKHWVDRELLAALLRAQLMYHTTPDHIRPQFMTLFLKYCTSVRSQTHPSVQAMQARLLTLDIDILMHMVHDRHWIVIIYAKFLRWLTSRNSPNESGLTYVVR